MMVNAATIQAANYLCTFIAMSVEHCKHRLLFPFITMLKRIFIICFLLTAYSGQLQAETYSGKYTYKALPSDTETTCRITAYDQVRRSLLHKIAGHIEQIIKTTQEGSGEKKVVWMWKRLQLT